ARHSPPGEGSGACLAGLGTLVLPQPRRAASPGWLGDHLPLSEWTRRTGRDATAARPADRTLYPRIGRDRRAARPRPCRPAAVSPLEGHRPWRDVPPGLGLHEGIRGESRLPGTVAHPRRVPLDAPRLRHPRPLAGLALDVGVRLHRALAHGDGCALRLPEQLV